MNWMRRVDFGLVVNDKIKVIGDGTEQSKFAGLIWGGASQDERNKFKTFCSECKESHKQFYLGYVYRPIPRNPRNTKVGAVIDIKPADYYQFLSIFQLFLCHRSTDIQTEEIDIQTNELDEKSRLWISENGIQNRVKWLDLFGEEQAKMKEINLKLFVQNVKNHINNFISVTYIDQFQEIQEIQKLVLLLILNQLIITNFLVFFSYFCFIDRQ